MFDFDTTTCAICQCQDAKIIPTVIRRNFPALHAIECPFVNQLWHARVENLEADLKNLKKLIKGKTELANDPVQPASIRRELHLEINILEEEVQKLSQAVPIALEEARKKRFEFEEEEKSKRIAFWVEANKHFHEEKTHEP